jgi:hypothetical protein
MFLERLVAVECYELIFAELREQLHIAYCDIGMLYFELRGDFTETGVLC